MNIINVENFIEILNTYKDIAFFISIFVSIIIAIAGVLPSIFVTGANVIFFGPINGVLISLLGETLGGTISFYLYRMGFKKSVEKIALNNKYLYKLVKGRGKESFYLVFLTRLLPFVPSGFVTLAASVSSINIGYFTIATFLGKIPSILLEGLISYDLINIKENWIRLAITIVVIIIGTIIIKRNSK